MTNQPCDTCGDSYKSRNKGKDTARQEAKKLSIEQKEPFSVCEEAGEFFAAKYSIAITNGFLIREIVSGLPATT